MRHGFIKVAAATPDIRVADVDYNKGQIIKQMDEAAEAGAKIIVFPELCITGYTCSDLFLQDILLNSAKKALVEIAEHTKNLDALVFVGVPIAVGGELYNVAAALNHGNILGDAPIPSGTEKSRENSVWRKRDSIWTAAFICGKTDD